MIELLKRIWYRIKGFKVFKNTGYEILAISGNDWISIQYSNQRGEKPIDILTDKDARIIIGTFPTRKFGKSLFVDAGKNNVERIKVPRV